MMSIDLNRRAADLCKQIVEASHQLKVNVQHHSSGATLIDCGVEAPGGLEAGLALAQVCMAGLGRVDLAPGREEIWPGPSVAVSTDHPVAACMASQYAGWKIEAQKFFAMGSGPMRSIAAQEPLFEKIGYTQRSNLAVGVLESRKLPPDDVYESLSKQCGIKPSGLTLLVAPTASLAGTVQVVARSVETALHKLFEIGFDLGQIESGFGTTPLPPPAADDMTGIGRTNDAILYASEVTLWVRSDDSTLEALGPKIPSSASADHGQPFGDIFAKAGGDFYAIDPHLFSPAVVTLSNLNTGRSFRFGRTVPRIIHRSFMP